MAKEKGGFSVIEPDVSPTEPSIPIGDARIDALKQKINDEDYLSEAIQRIAYVMSNEIAGVSGGRGAVERKG